MMEWSLSSAARATGSVLSTVEARQPVTTRFGAMRLLSHMCAACSACPRGREMAGEDAIIERAR